MTKAERIFKDTRFDCLQHLDTWGYQENENGTAVGFNRISYKDNETVSIRTINAVGKFLESAKHTLAIDIKLKILTAERAERETKILKMVESTLNNSRKSIEDFNKMLKEI